MTSLLLQGTVVVGVAWKSLQCALPVAPGSLLLAQNGL